jgi:hypothetical protein
VEVEHRELAEPVVVAVHERGSEEVLGPRRHGPNGVAAARGTREAANVEVALAEGRVDVLGGEVAVGAGVGEINIRNLRLLFSGRPQSMLMNPGGLMRACTNIYHQYQRNI